MKAKGLLRIALVAVLGLAQGFGLVSLSVSTAQAQFWGDPFFRPRPPRAIPQQQQNPFGGFFQQQQPFWQPHAPPRPSRAQMGDFSKAPPPRKLDNPPATTVVVMGDGMADWLGHGLEEAYTDNPEFGVVRKIRANSGLIRNESRTDSYDWVASARELLAQEKPDFIVVMLGLNDRGSIRERVVARPAAKPGQPAQPLQPPQPGQQAQPAQPGQSKEPGQPKEQAQSKEQGQAKSKEPGQAKEQAQQAQEAAQSSEGPTTPEQAAAEAAPAAGAPVVAGSATHEFRSDRWGELYAKRVDEMIAALKSKGVPVVWVGLPPIRGQRSRTDLGYLNDLFRARAQKAGITFVDVWDGFVDEDGAFSLRGPDYNGQIRQLRSADGIYFTKAGALKLGYYVEREIERLIASRGTPVALPAPEPTPQAPAKPGVPAPRPVAGPVMPLTAATAASEDLAGSGPARANAADPVATRVLVRGEAVQTATGRADDFSWPRAGGDDSSIIPATVTPAAAPPRAQRPGKNAPAAKQPADKAAPKRSGQAASAATPAPPPAKQTR